MELTQTPDFARMRWLMQRIRQGLQNIDELKASATRVSPNLTGMPTGKGTHTSRVEEGGIAMADASASIKELERELARQKILLAAWLPTLPEPDREAVRLRYMEGMSITRIVCMTCYSRSSVYDQLRRGEEKIGHAGQNSEL